MGEWVRRGDMEQEAVQSERPCHLSRSQVRTSGPSCPITCQLIEGCFNNVYTQCLITVTVLFDNRNIFLVEFHSWNICNKTSVPTTQSKKNLGPYWRVKVGEMAHDFQPLSRFHSLRAACSQPFEGTRRVWVTFLLYSVAPGIQRDVSDRWPLTSGHK